jgi:hypothetical protein
VTKKKRALTPALIDNLRTGSLADSLVPGLSIHLLKSGKKAWKYRRRVAKAESVVCKALGLFPAVSIADARQLARDLNAQSEAGVDAREVARESQRISSMTVARAHGLYMVAAQ